MDSRYLKSRFTPPFGLFDVRELLIITGLSGYEIVVDHTKENSILSFSRVYGRGWYQNKSPCENSQGEHKKALVMQLVGAQTFIRKSLLPRL